jgi:hypothetical protein
MRGVHPNWGQISPISRDDFVKQAGKLVKQIRYGTTNPKETQLKTWMDAKTKGQTWCGEWRITWISPSRSR